MPLAKQEGLTGKGIRIAVVDDGINLKASELQGADITVHGGYCLDRDTGKEVPADSEIAANSQHGTSVVAALVGNGKSRDGGLGATGIVPDAKIDFYATGPVPASGPFDIGKNQACPSNRDQDGSFSGNSWEPAIQDAVRSGAGIVSISMSGAVGFMDKSLAEAASRGVVVVGSADNPGTDSLGAGGFPAAGNGTVAVNAVGSDSNVIGTSAGYEQMVPASATNMAVSAPGVRILSVGPDWGPTIEHGTSYATPLIAGALALVKEKYPDATLYQAVQALIHTTDQNKRQGALQWDNRYGYGIVSVADMLKSDPSTYPNENPLFISSADDPRCKAPDESVSPSSVSDCNWARVPSPQDVAKATPTSSKPSIAPDAQTGAVFPAWLAVAVVSGVVAAILVATAIIVILVRRRARKPNHL